MIRVDKIAIREFRGIRDLTLVMDGRNFAACGPNGTGKSGIVDAIEFALTGNISRLSGAGTGGLSVRQHGPHVDSRNKPDDAYVELSVSIPSLGKVATVRRTVKDAGKPKISPADEDVRKVFDLVALHPEFVLSRRELIRYVLSEPGQRSKEVQALLRLDEVEKLRVALQRTANSTEREIPTLERAMQAAATHLSNALDGAELKAASVLAAINPKRKLLDLKPLLSLEATTSLKDGLGTAASAAAGPSRISKLQAQADLKALDGALAALAGGAFVSALEKAIASASALALEAGTLAKLSQEQLLRSALEVFDEEHCPVCDTDWEPDSFRAVVDGKLAHFADVAGKRKALVLLVRPVIRDLSIAQDAIRLVSRYAPLLAKAVDAKPLKELELGLAKRIEALEKLLPLDECLTALGPVTLGKTFKSCIKTIANGVAAIPEPTKQDAAREYLVVAQERLEAYRTAAAKLKVANARAARAALVVDLYGQTVTKKLEGVYKKVEAEFTSYYRYINSDDEGGFTARLIPSIGKLGFDVDFYGRGHFPPGAYHSEGHQDGMGLCLYLALMNHVLGKGFTFSVLDDVVMSVDAGHRREVCKLLKDKFPNTQFLFTTHDEVWLKHMRSAGLVKPGGFAHFRTWTVDLGPTEWDVKDVWAEIEAELKKNDVGKAAGLLRRYLEHFGREACERLRAGVEFRGDNDYQLGDVLPNAVKALGDLIKRGKAAASSWKQQDVVAAVSALEVPFISAKTVCGYDQWQMNAAIHFNAWADLQKQDFVPVVSGFQNLLTCFECSACGEALYVSPERGPKQALRCGCGKINMNLVAK